MTEGSGREHRLVSVLWIAVGGFVLAATLMGGGLIYSLLRAQLPPFFGSGAVHSPPARAPLPGASGEILVAGSGSNLPLTRRLLEAFTREVPSANLRLADSIGSGGGIRAVVDGVVGLGLISRPLTDREGRLGLSEVPYARAVVVFAAHPEVPVSALNSEDVLQLYSGERRTWPDGSPIAVVQRERGDSSHEAVNRTLAGFAVVNEESYRQKRFRVVYHDAAMQAALLSTPGAIGLIDLGAILTQGLPLKVLSFQGAEPSVQALQDGKYSFSKDLAFVTARPPAGVVAQFLAFTGSEHGRELIRAAGYLPLPEGTP